MFDGFYDMALDERRETLWGLRDGSAMHMNRIRREGFEALKHLILERDLPRSITHPPAPSNVVSLDEFSEKYLQPALDKFADECFGRWLL